MEELSKKEGSKFGMVDSVTAEIVRGGKVLEDKEDKSDKPKGEQTHG